MVTSAEPSLSAGFEWRQRRGCVAEQCKPGVSESCSSTCIDGECKSARSFDPCALENLSALHGDGPTRATTAVRDRLSTPTKSTERDLL